MIPVFLTALYDIVVSPLLYIVDLAFSVLLTQLGNPGLALIGVSLVVNFLCLPLYRMADRMQDEERARQARMADRVAQIKRAFKGDEQYMMLSTYYRQQGYKPIYALRGSLSLLLQVPVFMAAYNYLSSCEALSGASFLFLPDLGAPDGLIVLGGVTLNLMPIVMTLLNCASTYIYTRDLGLRDKVQAYGLAVVFLVLLYQSPSGLVFYWTCNQVFSLVKNIFLKVLPNPKRVFAIIMQIVFIWVWGFLMGSGALATFEMALLATIVLVALDYPILCGLFGWKPKWTVHPSEDKATSPLAPFLVAALLLTALVGLLIPSAVLGASPKEFVTASGLGDPMPFVAHTLCVQGGLFLLWVGTYFFLSAGEGRRTIAYWIGCFAVLALVDYFFFDQDLGVINTALVYDKVPVYDLGTILLNLLAVVAAIAGFSALWKLLPKAVVPVLAIMTAGLVWLAVPNLQAIATLTPSTSGLAQTTEAEDDAEAPVAGEMAGGQQSLASVQTHEATAEVPFEEDGTPLPIFNLSRKGRNVVVIFMDRCVGSFLPYAMNARPDLYEKLDGFTFYPNTISYGTKTVFGAPALYGGYDYSIERMNARDDMLLRDKHNEALRVMPTLFSQAGFEVTVSDPPMPNYLFSNDDLSVLDGIPNVTAYYTDGLYTSYYVENYLMDSGDEESYEDILARNAKRLRRNLCFYGFFRIVPTFLKAAIYDEGNYLEVKGAVANNLIEKTISLLKDQIKLGYEEKAERERAQREEARERALREAAPESSSAPAALDEFGNPIEPAPADVAAVEQAPEGQAPEPEQAAPLTPEEEAARASEARNAVLTRQYAWAGHLGRQDFHSGLSNWYSELVLLPQLTKVENGRQDHFLLIQNSTTHEPAFMQLPNFEPALSIDNTGLFDPAWLINGDRYIDPATDYQASMYLTAVSGILRLGEWFDYLREQGCYDNTRIIVVSDHGEKMEGLFKELQVDDQFNVEAVNPMLLVKDFNAHGFTTSYDFMTNADTPALALRDIVNDPINPFTGSRMNDEEKWAHDQIVTTSELWNATRNQMGTVFDTSDGLWYSLRGGDIFNLNNWERLEDWRRPAPEPELEPSDL